MYLWTALYTEETGCIVTKTTSSPPNPVFISWYTESNNDYFGLPHRQAEHARVIQPQTLNKYSKEHCKRFFHSLESALSHISQRATYNDNGSLPPSLLVFPSPCVASKNACSSIFTCYCSSLLHLVAYSKTLQQAPDTIYFQSKWQTSRILHSISHTFGKRSWKSSYVSFYS